MRRRVATLLLEPDPDEAAVRGAAAQAGWEPPKRIAALAWAGDGRRLRSRLPAGTLVADPGDDGGPGIALIPDPDAPGLAARLERAGTGAPVVLGPATELTSAADSAQRARAALRLIEAGVIPAAGFTIADHHLGALVAHGDERILAELAVDRLAPLADETPASRARLTETLRSWLDHQGEVARVAAELQVHPQTVRYRLGRLHERFGDRLADPEARFELALALRGVAEPRRAPVRPGGSRREPPQYSSEGATR